MSEKKIRPELVSAVLSRVLATQGIAGRVEQAQIIPEWASLVGKQIAVVTEPLSISSDGVLFVAVSTHAWMNELSLLEPELLAAINQRAGAGSIRKIRWQLRRT